MNHLIKHKDGYVALPVATILSSGWIDLSPTTRCVYKAMMTKYMRTGSEANGRVTWSQADLAKAAGISLRTVSRCIDVLLARDWMVVYEPGGRWACGTTYWMNPLYADGQSSKGYDLRDAES